MKNIIKNIIIAILTIVAISCSSLESDAKFAIGTVKYISLEGGFYGITTDDNKNLDPLNLSKEFQVDGKRISFKYVEKKDMASFHMWGTIVEIIEIKELK
jgi:inhibitor of cysteine peptidase